MKTNNSEKKPSEVKRRIFEVIDSMPEFEMRNLLIGLEKWKQNNGKRKHPRKDTHIFALFQNDSLSFRERITNISESGLFIETNIPISVTNELFIQFIHPETKKVIKANGKIVRVDPNGIGIKFDRTHPPLVLSKSQRA